MINNMSRTSQSNTLPDDELPGPLDPLRLLLVGCEPDRLESMIRELESLDRALEIEVIPSPEVVPRTLDEAHFDCVVAGYRMPGMDGLEFARRVRLTSDVPLIIYTVHGSEEAAAEALSMGVDAYINRSNPESVALLARRVREVVDSRRTDRSSDVAVEVLRVLTRQQRMEGALLTILGIVKRHTGVEAVGIRLHEGEDYPYYLFDGFPDEHILVENSLCAYDLEGQLMRDEVGNPVLECMCGNILRGRFDPSKPFFTEGGSFWTNSTTRLLESTSVEDRLVKTRDTCNGEGYESVALIPLRHGPEIVGLLQLNDSRPSRFNKRLIVYLEGLAEDIGTVIESIDQEKRLVESMEHYRAIFESVRDPIFIIDIDDFTVERSNQAARSWALARRVSPAADTCHKILAGRDVHCELYNEECPIMEMLEKEEGVSMVYRRFDKNGKMHYLEESANPMRDAEGRITRAILIVRDVTERKLAEERLNRYM